MPCLHNFCGGCLSGWVDTKKKDCPHCRKNISQVSSNPLLNKMVADFLEANPESKRDQEELDDLEERNKYVGGTVYPVTGARAGRGSGAVRARGARERTRAAAVAAVQVAGRGRQSARRVRGAAQRDVEMAAEEEAAAAN